jgi:hypothetical protein
MNELFGVFRTELQLAVMSRLDDWSVTNLEQVVLSQSTLNIRANNRLFQLFSQTLVTNLLQNIDKSYMNWTNER